MFSEITFTGWLKRAVAVAFCAALLLLGHKGYVTVTDHFAHVAELESANDTLTTNNKTLTGNNSTLKTSLSEQEAQLDTLQKTLAKREKDRQEYALKQAELEQELEKVKEDSQNEIDEINRAILLAGVNHTALPASVIRMLRDKARAINSRSRDGHKAGGTAASKSAGLSAVPGG
ncbi:hypothetical protein U9K49_23210 (plasmid) [Pantoea agglomerans]|uniref:hypothetical protein n=1 Tax=Enterobacter agglomerans TaxID=549 RepID=UPI002D77DF6F|nr:hypothetical protein [Pantoea agglomerans]WRO92859.1 hypothetical protein U9K49_23210 [Pantoea agglomerans]